MMTTGRDVMTRL